MNSPSTTIYSNGKITADSTDVVTINSSGIDIAGTLTTDDFSFSGDFSVNTDKFTVASATGNTAVAGTLDVTSDLNVNTDKFTIASATGNTAVAGTLDVTSDLNVNTDKFTIASATGNTAVAGTLDVTSDLNVNTDKFTVASATGNTAIAGDLDVTSNLNVNTDKFTVASATGNTAVAGTLDVTGNTALTGDLDISGNTTLTNVSINGNLDIVGTQTVINTQNINIQDKAITYGVITGSVHTQITSTQNTIRIKKENGITTNSVFEDAIVGYTVTNSSVDSISLTGHTISSIDNTSDDYLELTLNSNITLGSGDTIDVDKNFYIFNDGYSNTNDILLKGIYLKSSTEVASFGMGVDVSQVTDEVVVFHDTTVSNISSTTINSSALANLRMNEIAVIGNKIRSDDTIQVRNDNDTSFLGLEGLSFSSTSDERYKKNIRGTKR